MKRNLFLMSMLGFGVIQASGNEEVRIDPHATLEITDVESVDGSDDAGSRLSSFRNPDGSTLPRVASVNPEDREKILAELRKEQQPN